MHENTLCRKRSSKSVHYCSVWKNEKMMEAVGSPWSETSEYTITTTLSARKGYGSG